MAFVSTTKSGLNTNSLGAVTTSIDITAATMFSWCVTGATGAHANHKVKLEISFDNTKWLDSASHITGIDVFSSENDVSIGYIRFMVDVVEGATSTVDIIVNSK